MAPHRIAAGDRWRRLHQEDYCQALGKPVRAATRYCGPNATNGARDNRSYILTYRNDLIHGVFKYKR